MALISSSYSCNFGNQINSISKKQQTFGHAKNCSLGLKLTSNCIAKTTPNGFRNIDNHKSRRINITRENLTMEEFLNNGLVYQCHFLVKLYESRPNNKMTIFSIINQLLESKVNHFKSCGLAATGMGTTMEMTKRGLIWVVVKLQVVVDKYPSWNDIVQLRTWGCVHGKNSYRRDWIIRDHKTSEVLIRAICFYVLMNTKTRRLSKFCDEIKVELNPYFLDNNPIFKEDNIISRKLDVDADGCNHTTLVTRLDDIDMNQHVNNASYINFILEGTLRWVSENHWLSAVTIKYLKECGVDKQLQSLSVPIKNDVSNGDHLSKEENIKFHHSILTDGIEIVRALPS